MCGLINLSRKSKKKKGPITEKKWDIDRPIVKSGDVNTGAGSINKIIHALPEQPQTLLGNIIRGWIERTDWVERT